MRISFNIEDMCFKIMDLGVGLGTYSRLDHHGKPLILRSNQIINVGASILLVSVADGIDEETTPALADRTNLPRVVGSAQGRVPLLKLKVIGGPSYGRIFCRSPFSEQRKHVLGRVDDCDIYLSDQILSKRHCSFQFVWNSSDDITKSDTLGYWVLRDGFNSPSLNGTWVYLSEDTKITNKMVFKASEILFEATAVNN